MLKVYKNDIHRIIKEVVKLNPNDFVLIDSVEQDYPISTLNIKNSELKFIFRNSKDSWE